MLAKKCGISMPETKLVNDKFFATKRFDRINGTTSYPFVERYVFNACPTKPPAPAIKIFLVFICYRFFHFHNMYFGSSNKTLKDINTLQKTFTRMPSIFLPNNLSGNVRSIR